MPQILPQAAIIGAGPAGSVAAIILARSGWQVELVEQHRFPRDKVCGECLSALGVEVLRRLDLLPSLESLDHVRLIRTNLHAPNGSPLSIDLPRPMLGISRLAFDQFLLQAAARAGATVRQLTRCEQIKPNDRPELRLRSLETNRTETIRPDWVLVADGKSSSQPRPRATGDFGIKCHFEHVAGPRDAIELFGVRGCYGGLAPIEVDRWNLAFSVPRSRIQQHDGDIERLFSEILDENRALRQRFDRARRVTDWLAASLPRFGVRNHWPPRVIPIGNAAAAIEPIGGEGMGLAMRSAELAAQILLDSHRAEVAPELRHLRAEFRSLWRTRRFACRAAAIALSNSRLANFTLPALDGREPLVRGLLQVMGKSD